MSYVNYVSYISYVNYVSYMSCVNCMSIVYELLFSQYIRMNLGHQEYKH